MPDTAQLSPDRRLAVVYSERGNRPAFEALLRFDAELGFAVATASEPILAQIRLAWWRDALAIGGSGDWAGAPILTELARLRERERLATYLTAMVNGWEALLVPFPIPAPVLRDYAQGRGAGLFSAAALVAVGGEDGWTDAGMGWALADFAFHCSDAETAETAIGLARANLTQLPRFPKAMRPFALLARFAQTDSKRPLDRGSGEGSPSRLFDVMKVVLTGR